MQLAPFALFALNAVAIHWNCNEALPLSSYMAHLQIAQATAKLGQWPDSKSFASKLVFETDNYGQRRVRPPTFADGHGPIGIFAMLHTNEKAKITLQSCDQVFKTFCGDVKTNILETAQFRQQFDDECILAAPEGSHHITIAIFQEHPILLHNAEEIARWRAIDDGMIKMFEGKLSEGFELDDPAQSQLPDLTLDALLLTPDGALIACFLDSTENFLRLRSISNQVATDVLEGSLTSRPKTLIHATIGRILGLPQGCSSAQQARLTQLARHYNEEVLPNLVSALRQQGHDRFAVHDVSLVRNTVWLMYEHTIYASWELK